MEKKGVFVGTPVEGAPYTPGITVGNLVFVSGQVPTKPGTREIVEGFEECVRQCMRNVEAVLNGAGTDLDHVVKVTVFLKDLNNFGRLNATYNEFWTGVKPARTCVEVARLPLDVEVEIEAIAVLPD